MALPIVDKGDFPLAETPGLTRWPPGDTAQVSFC